MFSKLEDLINKEAQLETIVRKKKEPDPEPNIEIQLCNSLFERVVGLVSKDHPEIGAI